jgi:atlastin
MWSEPFVIQTLRNEEVAVLLMDTQGSFDSSTAIKDCASLFAFSLMVSSMQIYNLSQNIQEDDLHNLQLFADYGRLALDSTMQSPFQALIFLIRDWPYGYEYPFGFEGGQQYLLKKLNV